MRYYFDNEIAKKNGLECAVLLNFIKICCLRNEELNIYYFKNKYWTRLSIEKIKNEFPYMSNYVIIQSLNTLEKNNYILVDNFNDTKMDRTKWYSIK